RRRAGQRAADDVVAQHRSEPIEAERGEDVPRGHLAAVLVARHAVRAIFVITVGDLTHPKLRLPGLTAEVVEISVVVARLVVVLVVPAPEVLIESRIEFARPAHE